MALCHFLLNPFAYPYLNLSILSTFVFFRLSDYVDHAVRHVMMRQGVLGVTVSIMLPHDPTVREALYHMLTISRHASMRVTACCRGSRRISSRMAMLECNVPKKTTVTYARSHAHMAIRSSFT